MIKTLSIFIPLLSILSLTCAPTQKGNSSIDISNDGKSKSIISPMNDTWNYNFKTPSDIFVLDQELNEISGLAFDKKNNTFLTQNDESGKFFLLEKDNFSITNETKFSKKGDFESIEKVGDHIIICKNSGKLYFYNTLTKTTETYKTHLKLQNNVEGLCYLESSNSLLLACKGQPLKSEEERKDKKCIYSFDLEKKQLSKEAFLTISIEKLKNYIEENHTDTSKSKRKEMKKRVKEFAPSGIAVHPVTNDYYIISARASTIVIYDKDLYLKKIHFLDEGIIPQPEGITFDSYNNLFIATEGQGFNGKIFKFERGH